MPLKKKILRALLITVSVVFVGINVVAFFQAWKFSHFNPNNKHRIVADSLTKSQKVSMLLFGADIPRPRNTWEPDSTCETVMLQSNKKIECWYFKSPINKGTVILFHGYGDCKNQLFGRQFWLNELGYNTLMVDFQGAGGSEGNTCTIGYDEAQQVKTCVDYIAAKGEKNIHLLGISMGAAAVLKAMHDYQLPVKSLILECPFGSLKQAIKNRFKLMGVPSFPFTELLLFWGSLQSNCNFFNYSPADYAKSVKAPTLLLWGEKDDKVSRAEIDEIYSNLQGPKQLITYPNSYHESYLIHHRNDWKLDINNFLRKVNRETIIRPFYMDETEIGS